MRNRAIVGLKLLGVYFFMESAAMLVQFLIGIVGIAQVPHQYRGSIGWTGIGYVGLDVVVTIALAIFLMVRTPWVAEVLHFPEDRPHAGMEPARLLQIGLIVVGAYYVMFAVRSLGFDAIQALPASSHPHSQVAKPDFSRLASDGLELIMACILLGRSRRFAEAVFPSAVKGG